MSLETTTQELLHWFHAEYYCLHGKVVPGWMITYITEMMESHNLYLEHFTVGKKIKNWTVSAPVGILPDNFQPDTVPAICIRMGILNGFSIRGIEYEIPIEWHLYGLLFQKINPNDITDQKITNSITTKDFFHWYCMYYLGRRRYVMDQEMIAIWNKMLIINNGNDVLLGSYGESYEIEMGDYQIVEHIEHEPLENMNYEIEIERVPTPYPEPVPNVFMKFAKIFG